MVSEIEVQEKQIVVCLCEGLSDHDFSLHRELHLTATWLVLRTKYLVRFASQSRN